jgi:hypothetical protein
MNRAIIEGTAPRTGSFSIAFCREGDANGQFLIELARKDEFCITVLTLSAFYPIRREVVSKESAEGLPEESQ